jgi:hypothetical protein
MIHLDDYIDDLLSPDATAELRARAQTHLASCPRCREQWQATLKADDLLRRDRVRVQPARAAVLSARSSPHTRSVRHAGLVAALLILLAGGFGAGWWARSTVTTPMTGPDEEYLLLLVGSRASTISPDSVRTIARRFRSWTDRLRERGRLVSQGQLERAASYIAGAASAPLSRSIEDAFSGLNGYFIVRAADHTQARQIAESSPYLDLRGTIIVRPIVR